MQQTPPPAPPTPPPLASSNDLTASKFAQQNASLLSQVREQNQQMKDLREERDQLLDHVSSIGAKHATFQAMTEDNIKLGREVDQLKNLLKQKEDELVVELRKKDKDFLTVSDENITLKNENERLKTFKNQLFVGIKDRDTKIENLENAFTDLREKYYEMIQEVETSKALALAIKQVAAEGATIAHSTNIKRKQELGNNNKTSTLPSPPPQVQNLPNMNQIHLLNKRQQNINNRQMTTQQHQYQQHQQQYAMYSNNDSFNYNNNNNNNNYNNSPPPQSSSSYSSFQYQHGNDRFDSNQSFASSMADRYMNHKQRSPRQQQQLRNEFIEEYDDEIISGMDKKELQILRRKSQIAKQKVMLGNNNNNRNNGNNSSPTYSNSSSSQTSPKLAIRHTNGSYSRKNKSRTKKNAKAGRNKNIAFGKTNQRIGRASWIVHKDANYFINNSSVESRQWREFNTNSPDNTSSNGM